MRVRGWLLLVAFVALSAAAWSCALRSTHGAVPTQAGFVPATLVLGAGQSATVQLVVEGLTPGDVAAQYRINHDRTRAAFSQPSCIGGWAGADALLAVDTSSTWLGCTYLPGQGPASATGGPVLSVTITNVSGDAQDLVLNPMFTFFLLADGAAAEFPNTLGGLALRPPGTPTGTPPATASVIRLPSLGTLTAVLTTSPTPPPTETLMAVPTSTGTPTPPPTGTVAAATPRGTPTPRPATETPGCEVRVRVGHQEWWAPQPAAVCGTPPARGNER